MTQPTVSRADPVLAAGDGWPSPRHGYAAPAHGDIVVRGAAEAVGGPLGRHAATAGPHRRFTTAAAIILALTCLTLTLHWVQKSPCMDGNWVGDKQYRLMCYTDVLALYGAEGLSAGQVPYRDHAVEYPVLTGVFMGLIGLPVHALAQRNPSINGYEWFYNVNALVLCSIALASCAALLALRRRRPWDVAMLALSPILLLTATVNWDLLAVGFAAFGLYAWARRRPVLAGVLLGLGAAAKLWPGLILIPLLLLGVRARRLTEPMWAAVAAVLAWVAVNLPVMVGYPASWRTFFHLNYTRPIDWGTLWYIGVHFPVPPNSPRPIPGFDWLQGHIPALDVLTYALFGLACVGLAVLVLRAPRRPRVAQLAFLVVAAFLVFSKVWSQQYVLWLLPLAVLARPRWGAFLAWQAAEVCYFCAFYGELLGASGKPIFPEWVFVGAALLRLATVIMLAWCVIRDIRDPGRDVVRHTYADDPDGGVFDGAPDTPWLAARLTPAPAPIGLGTT